MERWIRIPLFAAMLWALFAPASAAAQPAEEAVEPLVVATVERSPFAMRQGDDLTGFAVDLWQAVAEALGRPTEFVEASSFSDMLDKVERGEVDAAIANITVTSSREAVMDFSQPMFDAGIRIMVRSEGTSVSLFRALLTPELLMLAGGAMVLLFAAANFMWLLERKKQDFFDHDYAEGTWRGFWWALNVIVNGGFEERMPVTILGRLFSVFLVFSSLFLVSAFVAKITATLTVSELQSQIGSIQDLYGTQVGTTSGSTAESFLEERSVRVQAFSDIAAMFEALEAGEVDAVVHDAPILDYYAVTDGRGRVQVVGEMLQPEKYAIAFPQGSDMVEAVNRSLLQLREDGTMDRLHDQWFERD